MPAKVSFEFSPGSVSRVVPEWMWDKQPLLAAIEVDTLSEVFGDPGEITPDQMLERHRLAIEGVARRKVQSSNTRPIEPVLLTIDDFTL